MAVQNPVIVIPGITGSTLRDEYPLDPQAVWGPLPFQQKWERVALHPDNLVYERNEPARVVPSHIFGVAYQDLIEELRHDLSPRPDRPTPVFPFAYDWRQPLEATEAQLELFIHEVIERTKLLKHYARSDWPDAPRVDLVGHSMGGLVITGLMARLGADGRVGRVATLGTPYRGSFEAPLKITTGNADLGEESRSLSREREIARLTPAIYYLLPSIAGGIVLDGVEPSRDLEPAEQLYDPALWQPSVVQTIDQYIQLYGVSEGNRREQAEAIFDGLLESGLDHRRRLDGLDLDASGLDGGEDGWLCVVGVGAETRVRLRIEQRRGKPFFSLRSAERRNDWSEWIERARRGQEAGEELDPSLTGDGTVPYEGAQPGFLPLQKLVCVSPGEFGYWELKDRALTRLSGFHGMLGNMNLVQRLVVEHLRGGNGRELRVWKPVGLPDDVEWQPPLRYLEDRGKDLY